MRILIVRNRINGTQSKCTKRRKKQSSAIKKLLEILFVTVRMCTGFTTDVLWTKAICTVSLANNLRATVADAFRL